ncbi:hypothetical protein KUTeg_012582 [Tegillarca granosa]|uniref:DOMON domain-containing protein n=1 Tax=Tegillarca granosa TaxID=220873 RepID=A0ABQ9EZZ7_TEGGR|nr:hypothetical protein KUTeg_012582 [Tegillarca granosa]
MEGYYIRGFLTYVIYITIIVTIRCQVSAEKSTSTALPPGDWKQAFVDEAKWSGYYVYSKQHIPCSLAVHSVQLDKYGVVLATFKDDTAQFDIQGVSNDDGRTVIFRMSTAQQLSDRIQVNSEFKLSGEVTRDKRESPFWTYHGNASVNTNDSNFGPFVMFAGDVAVVNAGGGLDDSKQVALTVGISLGAAVLGVALLVGIGVWAVRSGHLRHVPLSYKNFKNDAAYRNGESTVHI